jgi:hypothetical protein
MFNMMDEWFLHLDASDYMLRIIGMQEKEKETGLFLCIEFSYFHHLLLENGFKSVSYISFRNVFFCVSDLLSAGIDGQGWKWCKVCTPGGAKRKRGTIRHS